MVHTHSVACFQQGQRTGLATHQSPNYWYKDSELKDTSRVQILAATEDWPFVFQLKDSLTTQLICYIQNNCGAMETDSAKEWSRTQEMWQKITVRKTKRENIINFRLVVTKFLGKNTPNNTILHCKHVDVSCSSTPDAMKILWMEMTTSGLRHGETIKTPSTEHFSPRLPQSSQYVISLSPVIVSFPVLKIRDVFPFIHYLYGSRLQQTGRGYSFQSYLSND